MKPYHKIQTVFKRDPETNHKTLLEGDYSLPEFGYLSKNDWVFTEKVDGTNIRVKFNGVEIAFAGKSDNASIPARLVNALNDQFLPLMDAFQSKFGIAPGTEVCLYGEGYGAKIQKGGNYRPDQGFVLFDVNINGWWLNRDDVEDVAKSLGIDIVPVIGTGTLDRMVNIVRDGFNSTWGNFQAEGIVARPKTELRTRRGDRIITKLKCKDFRK